MNRTQWLSVWGFALGAAANPYAMAQTSTDSSEQPMVQRSGRARSSANRPVTTAITPTMAQAMPMYSSSELSVGLGIGAFSGAAGSRAPHRRQRAYPGGRYPPADSDIESTRPP